jgi:hypothetical protein
MVLREACVASLCCFKPNDSQRKFAPKTVSHQVELKETADATEFSGNRAIEAIAGEHKMPQP